MKTDKFKINLSDWEFEFQQRGEQPILLCDWWCRAIGNYFDVGIGINIPPFDYIFTDSSKGYCNPIKKQIVLKKIKEKLKDPKALKTILRNSIEIPKGFNAVADDLTEALKDKSISNEQLAKFWERMDADFIKVVPWFWYPYYISSENMLTDRVKVGLIKHKLKIEKYADLDEALLLLIFPTKKTAFQTEQATMFKLVKLAQNKKDFSKDLSFKKEAKAYLKKYDWLTTFILSPILPMTYEQLVERVRQAIRSQFAETYLVQVKAAQTNQKLSRKILNLIKSDFKLAKDIENARELAYVLTAGIEEAYVASSRYLDFMQLVAKRIGVKYTDTKYLIPQEMVAALRGQQIPPKTIEERKKGFVCALINKKQYLIVGDEGHKISVWVDKELNKVDNSTKEFKGQVACKGFSRAKVKVALNPYQAHELKEGEILVCPMTNPDYVPAMKRSSAIVTDEGGLLSHAAIMSREFNKPCVIGTKIATKVLKDGDRVEVDANNGTVTKL